MERRPLRNQSFSMLWKVLFLVVMELGIRNDLVDPDTGTLHEENEEEEELAEDPEIPPDDLDHTNGGSGSDNSDPPGDGHEPEEELNPMKDDVLSKHCGPPGDDLVGSSKTGENDMLVNGMDHDVVGADVKDETDILYDPFDRPPGEIVTQVWSRSRSRSPRRSLSV